MEASFHPLTILSRKENVRESVPEQACHFNLDSWCKLLHHFKILQYSNI